MDLSVQVCRKKYLLDREEALRSARDSKNLPGKLSETKSHQDNKILQDMEKNHRNYRQNQESRHQEQRNSADMIEIPDI